MTPKICFIIGGGDLPFEALQNFKPDEVLVIVLAESNCETSRLLKSGFHYEVISFTKVGRMIKLAKKHKIQNLCFVGHVTKPNFLSLRPDFTGILLLFQILRLRMKGDDNVLKTIINFLENRGLKIHGLETIIPQLLMKKEILTRRKPTESEIKTAEIGFKILEAMSLFDIGQSIVMQNRVVIGIEAVEGTDELIKRCAQLKYADSKSRPILVKSAKINQTLKIDMPVIGPQTIKNIAFAGFAGVFIKSTSSIIINREECVALADEQNIFIIGI